MDFRVENGNVAVSNNDFLVKIIGLSDTRERFYTAGGKKSLKGALHRMDGQN